MAPFLGSNPLLTTDNALVNRHGSAAVGAEVKERIALVIDHIIRHIVRRSRGSSLCVFRCDQSSGRGGFALHG